MTLDLINPRIPIIAYFFLVNLKTFINFALVIECSSVPDWPNRKPRGFNCSIFSPRTRIMAATGTAISIPGNPHTNPPRVILSIIINGLILT